MMKYFVWLLLLVTMQARGQDSTLLTLDECRALARSNYPLLKQQQVLDSILQLQVKNIQSAYLPQATVNGQATYQSDVTQLPIKMPGIEVPVLPKDQYRATVDVNQLLYDGGANRSQRYLQTVQQRAEQQKVEVELYRLKQQVTQVYFSALLAEEYVRAAQAAAADIQQRMEKQEAGVRNGSVLPSNVEQLKAELLKVQQQEIGAATGRSSALAALQLLTGRSLPATVKLALPPQALLTKTDTLARPELQLYRLQSSALQQQSRLTGARQLPRISAFVQGGYGRPGLNMLDNDFKAFYMGGIRLNWTLWNWHYNRREQQVLALQQRNIEQQAAAFTLNTNVQLAQQSSEIAQLQQLLEKDRDIIDLRISIRESSAAQLDNGVITVHDYLSDLNAETQARISRRTHEIQLAQARINYQLTKGY